MAGSKSGDYKLINGCFPHGTQDVELCVIIIVTDSLLRAASVNLCRLFLNARVFGMRCFVLPSCGCERMVVHAFTISGGSLDKPRLTYTRFV